MLKADTGGRWIYGMGCVGLMPVCTCLIEISTSFGRMTFGVMGIQLDDRSVYCCTSFNNDSGHEIVWQPAQLPTGTSWCSDRFLRVSEADTRRALLPRSMLAPPPWRRAPQVPSTSPIWTKASPGRWRLRGCPTCYEIVGTLDGLTTEQ